jgi:transcriptional regulator with XRE-family HTH domain
MDKPPIYGTWGARIRSIRKDKGLTLDELASRTKISRTSLSVLENGKRDFRISQIEAIANALGVSVQRIIKLEPRDSRLSA